MKILSVSTSSKLCSVSILEDNNLINEIRLDNGLTHSETLLPIIDEIFKKTNLNLKDINLIVCDKGPGSFTGIRIGIATIKAFSDSLNIPCIGVSSLESLAYNVKNEGIICSIIDAKNENVYFSIYRLLNNKYQLLENPTADSIDNLLYLLKKYNEKITFVGDGSVSYKDKIKISLSNIEFSNNNDLNSFNLGLAGLYKYKENNFEDVLPLYLKKPQAERMLEEKNNAN